MITSADMERISRDALENYKKNVDPSHRCQRYFSEAIIESLKKYERETWTGSQGKLYEAAKYETP
jgi:hypothetical protein